MVHGSRSLGLRTCATLSLPQVALPRGRVCGKCLDTARLQKRLGNRIWVGGGHCRRCGSFLNPQLQRAENLKQRRSHAGALNPGITTEPRRLTALQSRPTDILTATAVTGRTAALDVCVASSVAAAARGDAAQAAFDRKLSHCRNFIGESRQQNIHYRPLVWTADGWPHPAVTRTRQYATDIASSRNVQHMSAKSLHRRWKHEIQVALLRRRAAMARAVLPNPSARAVWLFAGIIDRALHRWRRVPALDGGPGDHDLDEMTMTLSPWRAAHMNLCSHQVPDCPVYPPCDEG